MFKLKENTEIVRKVLNCDYIRYSLAETSTINKLDSQIQINIPREDSVLSLLISYLDRNFEVIEKTDISRYANGNDIRLINLGPIVSFSILKLTMSPGKHLKGFSHAHIFSLMYNLTTSAKDSDD